MLIAFAFHIHGFKYKLPRGQLVLESSLNRFPGVPFHFIAGRTPECPVKIINNDLITLQWGHHIRPCGNIRPGRTAHSQRRSKE